MHAVWVTLEATEGLSAGVASDACIYPYPRLFCTWTVDARKGRRETHLAHSLAHAGVRC